MTRKDILSGKLTCSIDVLPEVTGEGCPRSVQPVDVRDSEVTRVDEVK